MSKAVHDDPALAMADETEIMPQEAYPVPRWQPPPEPPALIQPPPVDDLSEDQQRWIDELPLTAEQRRDAALVR